MDNTLKCMPHRWTVISRRNWRYRQTYRRFWAPRIFNEAKKIALSIIKGRQYEGLFLWTHEEFAYAVEKAKLKRDLKRARRK